jgi:hypothetical protein
MPLSFGPVVEGDDGKSLRITALGDEPSARADPTPLPACRATIDQRRRKVRRKFRIGARAVKFPRGLLKLFAPRLAIRISPNDFRNRRTGHIFDQ